VQISSALYAHVVNRLLTTLRGVLVAAMLDKSLKFKDSDDDAAVTLMTADIEGIFPGVKDVYELVANTVELVLAMYLLQREIGAACFLVAVSAIGRSYHILLAMTSSQHLLSLTYLCLNLHSLQLPVHIRQRRHRPSTNGLGGGNAEACIDDFPVPHPDQEPQDDGSDRIRLPKATWSPNTRSERVQEVQDLHSLDPRRWYVPHRTFKSIFLRAT